MIKTLCNGEAAEELFRDENANWTRAGAYALVEYLENLEEDMGKPIEFDRVAIRCDFAEWKSLVEWAEDYFAGDWRDSIRIEPEDSDAEIDAAIREYINYHGQLIEFDGGIIVSAF